MANQQRELKVESRRRLLKKHNRNLGQIYRNAATNRKRRSQDSIGSR